MVPHKQDVPCCEVALTVDTNPGHAKTREAPSKYFTTSGGKS